MPQAESNTTQGCTACTVGNLVCVYAYVWSVWTLPWCVFPSAVAVLVWVNSRVWNWFDSESTRVQEAVQSCLVLHTRATKLIPEAQTDYTVFWRFDPIKRKEEINRLVTQGSYLYNDQMIYWVLVTCPPCSPCSCSLDEGLRTASRARFV